MTLELVQESIIYGSLNQPMVTPNAFAFINATFVNSDASDESAGVIPEKWNHFASLKIASQSNHLLSQVQLLNQLYHR